MSPASSASGKNFSGGTRPELGVGPANEGFDGQDLAGLEVQLGLVVQDEVALP